MYTQLAFAVVNAEAEHRLELARRRRPQLQAPVRRRSSRFATVFARTRVRRLGASSPARAAWR